MLGEHVRQFISRSKVGKSSRRISTVQFLTENYMVLMENQLSSSEYFRKTYGIVDSPDDPEISAISKH